MKKVYLFTILSLFVASSQAQIFQWAKAEGLWAYDYGYGTGVDNAGNLYVSGKYEDNAIFSGTTLTNHSTNHDMYVAKYNTSGGLMWIRTGGGSLGDYSHAMHCDGTSAVYSAGEIEGLNALITFPGSTITLTSVGDNDAFIAKYDLNGNLLFAKSEGWYGSEKAQGITTDASGNIYVCGFFTDTTRFNGTIIGGAGGRDMFLAKYDTNGNFLWFRKAGSAGRDEAKAVKCDALGNVYICGMYSNNAMFGAQTLTCTAGYFDTYLAKYDPSGNLVWVKKGGSDYDDVAWSLTIDNQNKIYVSGEFNAYAVFGPNALTTTGNADAFVACYNSSGAEQWAVKAGGSLIDRARAIGTDGTNIFITGQYGGTGTFGTQSFTAADSSDVFISALNGNGTFLWTSVAGGAADAYENLGYESGIAICAEATGNVFATGSILNGATFGSFTVSPYTRTDVFVTKLNSQPVGLHENSLNEVISMYPNPSKGIVVLDLTKYTGRQVEVTVYNTLGQIVENKIYKTLSHLTLDLGSQADGIYFAEVKGDDQIISKKKIIIQH